MPRYSKVRSYWIKYKLTARLKVLVVIVALIFLIRPLRNLVVPGWPDHFRDLSTFKVIRVHLQDLFFYIDRSPYQGSCKTIHEKLKTVKMPKLEDMPYYDPHDFFTYAEATRNSLTKEDAANLHKYKPHLSKREQQMLLYTVFSVTQALSAFNITHFLSEGSLLGYWRHHGLTPWDDDVDMMFDCEMWPLARKIISCVPDIQLNMGSDYMWKAYHKDSDLWRGESYIKFPFVDIFPYRNDSEHMWPLTIWVKSIFISPVEWIFPTIPGIFEGWPVAIPGNTPKLLAMEYGDRILQDCYSRTFKRREREMVPLNKRYHLNCSILNEIYPFVRRQWVDASTNTVVEERMLKTKVLSTFNAPFKGLN